MNFTRHCTLRPFRQCSLSQLLQSALGTQSQSQSQEPQSEDRLSWLNHHLVLVGKVTQEITYIGEWEGIKKTVV